jgi:hypothetical protein
VTTLCVIAAACILIAGLFAVIVERTNERDEARDERDSALAQNADLLAEVDRFGELTDTLVGDALTLAAQLREANLRAWDAEHAPLADVVPIEGLRVVEDLPNGDDDIWLNLYDENGQHR